MFATFKKRDINLELQTQAASVAQSASAFGC